MVDLYLQLCYFLNGVTNYMQQHTHTQFYLV